MNKEEFKIFIDTHWDREVEEILLSDKTLMRKFLLSPSTIKEAATLKDILVKNAHMSKETWESIYNEYGPYLVKAGTKGSIRGNVFNHVVKEEIESINSKRARKLIIKFEKKHEVHVTDEIPDFTVEDPITHKVLIGMNQIDMWGGGQQVNRLTKYMTISMSDNNMHLVSCVARKFKINDNTKTNSKVYQAINKGFSEGYIIYRSQLESLINSFFESGDSV